MHGVTEGIEDRRYLLVDAVMVAPDVRHGQRNELGECAGPVDAHALRGGAQVTPACKAVAAASADHVAFAANQVTGKEVVDVGADGDDFAHELMPDRHGHGDGFARPFVPLVYVQVRTADSGVPHAHQHVVNADRGFGDFFEPQAALGLAFYQGLHGQPPSVEAWFSPVIYHLGACVAFRLIALAL